MTTVPYTATYQSWHLQHIPKLAEQLGPTVPGFDEHERHSLMDSSQQAIGEVCALMPCAAKFSIPPAGQPPASGSIAVYLLSSKFT